MPFRIATGGQTITDLHFLIKNLADAYIVLGWLGLLAIMLGTLLQVWAPWSGGSFSAVAARLVSRVR